MSARPWARRRSAEPAHGPACTVRFVPGGETVAVPAGTNLFTACRKARLKVPNLCGNNALCGTCVAEVVSGSEDLSPRTPDEERTLSWFGAPDAVRLTCQATVHGDVVVRAAISPIERDDYDPADHPWGQR